LINCLNSLFLAHEDRFVVTPVAHVFAMYAAHQGGQALRTIFSAPTISYDRDSKQSSFWGLKGSASLRHKELTLTVVNPHVADGRDAEVIVRDAQINMAEATVLTHADIHAHNTFSEKNVVAPQSASVDIKSDALNFRFPPASVTKLTIKLS